MRYSLSPSAARSMRRDAVCAARVNAVPRSSWRFMLGESSSMMIIVLDAPVLPNPASFTRSAGRENAMTSAAIRSVRIIRRRSCLIRRRRMEVF